MNDDPALWGLIWRSLALGLIEHGCYPVKDIERLAKKQKWPLRIVRDVAERLGFDSFEYDGQPYWRLSDRVIPLLPRLIPNAQTYRRATSGGAAA